MDDGCQLFEDGVRGRVGYTTFQSCRGNNPVHLEWSACRMGIVLLGGRCWNTITNHSRQIPLDNACPQFHRNEATWPDPFW